MKYIWRVILAVPTVLMVNAFTLSLLLFGNTKINRVIDQKTSNSLDWIAKKAGWDV